MATNPLGPFFTGLPIEVINSLAQEINLNDQPLALSAAVESSLGPTRVSQTALPEISICIGQFLKLDATNAPIIQILPIIKGPILKAIPGGLLAIAEVGEGTNPIIIAPTSPDKINSKATFTLNPGAGCWIVCDGNEDWTVVGLYEPRAGTVLHWGNTSVGAQAGIRYLSPGFTAQTATTDSVAAWVAPRDGILNRFSVRHNANSGNGNDVVYDIVVGGTPATLGLTLATGAVGNTTDNVSTVSVNAGALVEVTNTKASSLGNSAVNVLFTCVYR